MNRRTFVIILLLILCLANVARWTYSARTGTVRFSAESAAHYRYTRMIASGEKIPRLDRDAQFPEGLKVREETSIGLEYLYGLAWRCLPGGRPPLDRFVRFFSVLIFTLAAVPLSLLSRGLWRSRGAGLLTALLFAVSVAVAGRSSGYEIIRENLTLPLIVFHLWLFTRTARTGSLIPAALSALLLFAALATWQGTQFYIVPLVLFLVIRVISGRVKSTGERAACWAVVIAAAAATAVPFLRAGGFPASCAGASETQTTNNNAEKPAKTNVLMVSPPGVSRQPLS